ncbi:MAG TPA: helix-turn-helix transcriptional regulator, partial [Novosphingobium sp.]|nr:helix-turn-helix transcriptional regulator [Novosphingobium sp.]
PALSPDAIALGLGVSRRQLYRAFAEAGQTPASWLWSLRTEQAHLRLTSPQECAKSLTQLAFDVGFNDMAHFSRSYRARFGCTPRQARLNAAGGAGG